MATSEHERRSPGRFSLGKLFARTLLISIALFLIAGNGAVYFLSRYFGIATVYLLIAVAVVCVAAAIVAETLWRTWTRPLPSDYCNKCGYDLTLNESGMCPECGSRIPETNGESPPQSKSSGTR